MTNSFYIFGGWAILDSFWPFLYPFKKEQIEMTPTPPIIKNRSSNRPKFKKYA